MARNARHHLPRIQRSWHGVLRMKVALFAVGCMPLLCVINAASARTLM
ncbi:MAG: hypothetical protein M3430_06640 [Acidobacteriota bacterium]|nr:hypothetical protein [Acidobacteriota bacterium]